MIVWSSQPWKKILLFRFFKTDGLMVLKPMPNSSSFSRSLLTLVTDVSFALVSRVLVPYIRFIAVNHS
jgi:hypothetical protein